MSNVIDSSLISNLNKISSPDDLIANLVKNFKNRAAIGTSGQLSGSVLIDLAIKAGVKPRIFTIDTFRLFKETYEFFNEIEKHYNINVEVIQPKNQETDLMVKKHGEYLFFDSKEKQELCCHTRKVIPNNRILKSLDVWITGLRLDQSSARKKTARFEIIKHADDGRSILKVAPLVDWTEEKLRDYIKKNNVPIHPLLEWNQDGWRYESLGCVICTTPIGTTEARRSGRWRWFNQGDTKNDKECGLHTVYKDEV